MSGVQEITYMVRVAVRLGLVVLTVCAALVALAIKLGETHASATVAFVEFYPYIDILQILDIESGLVRRLPYNGYVSDALKWSPDGNSFVFTCAIPDEYRKICIAQLFPPAVQVLTSDDSNSYLPTWSPDGRNIAFISTRDGRIAVDLMNADGSNLRHLIYIDYVVLSETDWFIGLNWSPTGQWIIAELAEVGSFIIDITVPNMGWLVDGTLASWSPDGTMVTYQDQRSGSEQIYAINVETGDEHRLTNYLGYARYPIWSPDGLDIAFVGTSERGQAQIGIMNRDGSNQRFLPLPYFTDIESMSWSPDGTQIVFSARDATAAYGWYEPYTSFDMYVVNPDGSDLRRVVDGPPANVAQTYSRYFSLAWQP